MELASVPVERLDKRGGQLLVAFGLEKGAKEADLERALLRTAALLHELVGTVKEKSLLRIHVYLDPDEKGRETVREAVAGKGYDAREEDGKFS